MQPPSSAIYTHMGHWDVSAEKGYWLDLALLPSPQGLVLKGLEIEVEIQGMAKPSSSLKWWTPASGSLPSGKTPGRFLVLPAWLAKDLKATIKSQPSPNGWPVIYAIIQPVATNSGGIDVLCSLFVYPIEVCNGCLKK